MSDCTKPPGMTMGDEGEGPPAAPPTPGILFERDAYGYEIGEASPETMQERSGIKIMVCKLQLRLAV